MLSKAPKDTVPHIRVRKLILLPKEETLSKYLPISLILNTAKEEANIQGKHRTGQNFLEVQMFSLNYTFLFNHCFSTLLFFMLDLDGKLKDLQPTFAESRRLF